MYILGYFWDTFANSCYFVGWIFIFLPLFSFTLPWLVEILPYSLFWEQMVNIAYTNSRREILDINIIMSCPDWNKIWGQRTQHLTTTRVNFTQCTKPLWLHCVSPHPRHAPSSFLPLSSCCSVNSSTFPHLLSHSDLTPWAKSILPPLVV